MNRLAVVPISAVLLLLLVSSSSTTTTHAFQLQPVAVSSSSSSSSSSFQRFSSITTSRASAAAADVPARVVPETLPIVYVYDHCPFCVRVRVALGLKNIKHEVRFLANDDVATPTNLIGKKMAPIFQWGPDLVMAESLDIIALIDQDDSLGSVGYFQPATGRTDLKAWQGSVRDLLRNLQRPRYVATGLLPEFQQADARLAFVKNHQLPGYEKAAWKTTVPETDQVRLYQELLQRDPSADVALLNQRLVELDQLVYCPQHCSEGGLSYDDIDLFARLRSVTIIKGVEWPEKLRAYMDYFSKVGDVPLYDAMAL